MKKAGWINLVKDFDEINEEEAHPPVKPTQNLNRPDYLLDAQECMKEMFFSRTDRDIWEDFSRIVMNCTPYDEMRIKIYSNSFRYHYFQKPARYEDNEFLKKSCQLVSIGTNVDVKAELTFSENYPHCKFLGVDPNATEKETAYKQYKNHRTNVDTIFEVGKFVNALVTTDGKTRESTSVKGNITTKIDQQTLEVGEFFSENLENKIIDVLWMDNEYEEYDLLPFFLKDSPLFRDGWRICQIQVEIHGHLEKVEIIRKYAKFVKAMFEEGRYLPIHSMQSVHIM
ncbi:unnamed protein product, partial [Mesorhabditis belari]|uniref:Methyltransferase FkbM domain-containing protein n=1 Tax=Mesorhabditis belari TaxID=2138241 RepID=A0AAF3F3V4_9BILA